MWGFIPFPKGICPKVNVIARLEFELAYYDSAVHRFNHYTTRTPPLIPLIIFVLINRTILSHKNSEFGIGFRFGCKFTENVSGVWETNVLQLRAILASKPLLGRSIFSGFSMPRNLYETELNKSKLQPKSFSEYFFFYSTPC